MPIRTVFAVALEIQSPVVNSARRIICSLLFIFVLIILGFFECSPRKIIKVSFRNAFLLAEGLITQDNSLMFDLQGAMQRKGTSLYVDITAAIKYLKRGTALHSRL